MNQRPGLYILHSEKRGRGVYTSEKIEPNEIIEVCPVIVLPSYELPIIHKTSLHDYYFLWSQNQCAIALGFGSLYNHNEKPNAVFEMDYEADTIDIRSTQIIYPGSEITINYHEGDAGGLQLWFDPQ